MPKVRRTRPPRKPESLAEKVIDINQRLEQEGDDDELADVWIEGKDWRELVGFAGRDYQADFNDIRKALAPRDGAGPGEVVLTRTELADALGWGSVNSAADLLQVVRGYVVALEIEVEHSRGLGEAIRRMQQHDADVERGYAVGSKAVQTCVDCGGVVSGDATGLAICSCSVAPSEVDHVVIDERQELAQLRALRLAIVGAMRIDEATDEELVTRVIDANRIEFDKNPPTVDVWADNQARFIFKSGGGSTLTHEAGVLFAAELLEKIEAVAVPGMLPHGVKEQLLAALKRRVAVTPRELARRARMADPKCKRRAMKATKEDSPTVCHHCGATSSDDTGGLGRWSAGDRQPAVGTFCTECREHFREIAPKATACKWCEEEGHTDDECALAPSEEIEDAEPSIVVPAGSDGGEDESYCRSCRKWFPAGTHTHAHAPKSDRAGAELAKP